jgi:hypothetical protein
MPFGVYSYKVTVIFIPMEVKIKSSDKCLKSYFKLLCAHGSKITYYRPCC